MTTEQADFRAYDGQVLSATLTLPDRDTGTAAVLVHGGGVDRHEGGFFDRLAGGLAAAGAASIRFDLRGHGSSGGDQAALTIAMILSDIHAAAGHVRRIAGTQKTALIGASFAGGACAWYAARNPLDSLVLLNPQLDYRRRIMSRGDWQDGQPSGGFARQLHESGYVQFTPSLRHGPAIVAESLWLDIGAELDRITAPTLIMHGDADTLVPVRGSREASQRIRNCRMIEVPGAQHGFAVDGDPAYEDPRSQSFQSGVIRFVSDWVSSPAR